MFSADNTEKRKTCRMSGRHINREERRKGKRGEKEHK